MKCFRPGSVRYGLTLIEVLGTLAVLLVLAVSAVHILGYVTQIGVQNNDSWQDRNTVQRLAGIFRSDVRSAADVNNSDDGTWPLNLMFDEQSDQSDQEVLYDWDEKTLSLNRLVKQNNERLAFERFQFSNRFTPRLEVTDQMVTLIVKESTDTAPWRIEVSR